MKQTDMNGNILIFLHIPKTAGNSVFNVIRRQYPASSRYDFNMDWDRRQETIDEFAALTDKKKRAIAFVGGHTFYGLHRVVPQPAVYMTFMRDPVDRFISHYYFSKESSCAPLKRKLEEAHQLTPYQLQALEFLRLTESRCGSLQDFLELSIDLDVVNIQTRMIGGFVDPSNLIPPFQKLPENAVEVARDNLNRDFPVVGLVEHFDTSLLLFRKAFGWSNVFYARHNQTRSRPSLEQVPRETRRMIKEASRMDIELYEEVKTRFNEQVASLGNDFSRQLAQFQAGTRCYTILRKVYCNSGLKKLRQLLR